DIHFACKLGAEVFAHEGFRDRTWAERIYTDALASGFRGIVASEAEQTCFCRGVGRAPTESGLRGNAGDVQDDAMLALVHSGQHQLAEQKCRPEMNSNDLVKLGEGIFLHSSDRAVMATVVHENVHAAKELDGL